MAFKPYCSECRSWHWPKEAHVEAAGTSALTELAKYIEFEQSRGVDIRLSDFQAEMAVNALHSLSLSSQQLGASIDTDGADRK